MKPHMTKVTSARRQDIKEYILTMNSKKINAIIFSICNILIMLFEVYLNIDCKYEFVLTILCVLAIIYTAFKFITKPFVKLFIIILYLLYLLLYLLRF